MEEEAGQWPPGWLGARDALGHQGRVFADISSTRGLLKKQGIQDAPKTTKNLARAPQRGPIERFFNDFHALYVDVLGQILVFCRIMKKTVLRRQYHTLGGFCLSKHILFVGIYKQMSFFCSSIHPGAILRRT